MKNLRLILIVITVIICILIIIILGLSRNRITNANTVANNIYTNEENSNNIKLEKVKNESIYYTAKATIQKFYNYVYEKNTDVVISMLDKEYINENKITIDNLYTKIQLNAYKKLSIDEMYEYEDDVNYLYIKGNLTNQNINLNEKAYDIYFFLKLDKNQNIFSIMPISKDIYENSITNNTIYNTEKLQINNYNNITYQNLSDYIICGKYLEDYRNKIQNNVEEAYNLLDVEYRIKRFKTLEKFKTYVNENIATLKSAYVNKYIKTDEGNYIEYVCVDKYDNYYIFNVTATMEYTVKLDTYTIKTDKFKTEYNKATSEGKVGMNTQIFIQMINAKDYENAYNLLADGFKSNYFKTLDEFKTYVKNNFFEYNSIEAKGISTSGTSYVCNIEITDATKKNTNTIQKNIIMQLKDNMEFVMSFNV